MKEVFLIYFIVCLCSIVLGSNEGLNEDEYTDEDNTIDAEVPTSNCWMSLNTADHIKTLDKIDASYANVREQVQESLQENDFDKTMVEEFKKSRGVAIRELHAHDHQEWMIPSGMNLGGYCMLRMPGSVLFFHRMKLRNNTYFGVDFLYNDLSIMAVKINLALNDLHLKGAYERSLTESDPSVLMYAPTFGEVEFQLKDVKYKMEGRYRLIKNRLLIELVTSEILVNDNILMKYVTKAIESSAIKIEKEHLGNFMSRLKTDLDKWMKDYFNDYLILKKMDEIRNIEKLTNYDKEKNTALEEFTDNSIHTIATRIRHLKAESISLPPFTFKSSQGLKLKLYEGALKGLDSMYRRSVATGYKKEGILKVDTVVGFSNLKVVYKYEAWIPTGVPPLAGVFTLTANELTAHLALAISLVSKLETIDLDIEFLDLMKPDSLTIEGAANLMIANFKHLLEHQILATMFNTLTYGVLLLKSLPKCEPFKPGHLKVRLSDARSSLESEEMLRGKTNPMRRSTNYPKSLMKLSNRSVLKKNQTALKIFKGKSKKSYNRKQDIVMK